MTGVRFHARCTPLLPSGTPPGVLELTVLDVTRADAPARVIAQRRVNTVEAIEIEGVLDDPRHDYAAAMTYTVDGRLAFLSTRRHPIVAGEQQLEIPLTRA